MHDLSGAGALLNAVRDHLHTEVVRVITERGLSNEEVARVTGRCFNRHKRYRLLEGPAAIRWSPATFIDVAQALGIPVSVSVAGTPISPPSKGKATSSRRPGSPIRSPALAA